MTYLVTSTLPNLESTYVNYNMICWEDQKIIEGTLGDIVKKTKEAKIIKTAVIIVGDVIAPKKYEFSKVYDAGFTHGYRRATK